MKLLLHTCCAPCLIYPLKELRRKDFFVEGFFYNPNIHPFSEYRQRKQAVEEYGKAEALVIKFPEYAPREFFQTVNGMEDIPQRCAACWKLRLRKTAQTAKENGYTHFSSTLLVSPYQDQEALKKIGTEAEDDTGVAFYYEDFRPGFHQALDTAKERGIYCQKYCGCIYSEIERFSKKK